MLWSFIFASQTPAAPNPKLSRESAADQLPKDTIQNSVIEARQRRNRDRQQELQQDGERRFLYATMLYTESYYKRAQELYEAFLLFYEKHPRRLEALRYLAMIAQKQGRLEEALAAYIDLYKEAPNKKIALEAYLEGARLAKDMGLYKASAQMLKELLHSPASYKKIKEAAKEEQDLLL